MNEYLIPPHGQETHRVIQHLEGKDPPRQEAISEYGDILCESCDACIAMEGTILKIGHRCWRCWTPVVAFEPILPRSNE
jgi:hypothetical protein